MIDGAGPISNDAFRKLPGDSTAHRQDNEKPSGRKIGGLFRAQRISRQFADCLVLAHNALSPRGLAGGIRRVAVPRNGLPPNYCGFVADLVRTKSHAKKPVKSTVFEAPGIYCIFAPEKTTCSFPDRD
jgi:hypothetical protein